MVLPDVNVLVYAYRRDMADHHRYRDWVSRIVNAGRPYGVCEFVLSSFVRVVTNPRVFRNPGTPSEALSFTRQLLSPSSHLQNSWGLRLDGLDGGLAYLESYRPWVCRLRSGSTGPASSGET